MFEDRITARGAILALLVAANMIGVSPGTSWAQTTGPTTPGPTTPESPTPGTMGAAPASPDGPAVPDPSAAPATPDAADAPKPVSSEVLLRRVANACRGETGRFCPELRASATGRDEVICLKYHKNDLSLGCRGAINAATR
jgi:hypothetical protein